MAFLLLSFDEDCDLTHPDFTSSGWSGALLL